VEGGQIGRGFTKKEGRKVIFERNNRPFWKGRTGKKDLQGDLREK